MHHHFTFHMPTRLIWHSPAHEAVAAHAMESQARRVLIVTDPGVVGAGLVDPIRTALEGNEISVTVHGDVSTNPTTADVAAARAAAESAAVELIVAVGGGSAIDTAKATAMLVANGGDYAEYQWSGRPITRRSHPFVAVPTTAGTGSEVSKVAVISDPSQPFKKGVLSPLMFAHAAVIDPRLTVGLPAEVTAATGIDAFVHALEAYTGLGANPMSDMVAIEAIRLVVRSLRRATADGGDLDARADMMLAAVYGGMAMDQAGLGLVHAISGGLCSHLHLHHGYANALLLPYVAAFNMEAIASDRRRRLNVLFGLPAGADGSSLVEVFTELVTDLGLPVGLADRRDQTATLDWEAVAEESMRMVMVKNNPRPVALEDCQAILQAMR